jgi:dihydrofolate synthase/folylpolyglutamate synthase
MHFAKHETDLVILETGMGGRLDATNVVQPLATVIMPIALDHQQWLGQSLKEIAGEKAGIMKPGVPCISAPQAPEAAEVLRQHGPVKFVEQPYDETEISLPGAHQKMNAAVAIEALRIAGYNFPSSAIAEGLRKTAWPARFQQVGRALFLDGAHNPAGAEALVQAWKARFPDQKAHLIFGAVAAKDVRSVVNILLPIAADFQCVTMRSPRAMGADELVRLVLQTARHPTVRALDKLTLGLDEAEFPTLVTGSLYLCGEALAHLQQGRAFEVSSQ